jgi:hypothetical protein
MSAQTISILVPLGERLSCRYTNEEDGETLLMEAIRARETADLVAPANNKHPRFYKTWVKKHRFDRRPITSGLPSSADIPWGRPDVANLHISGREQMQQDQRCVSLTRSPRRHGRAELAAARSQAP